MSVSLRQIRAFVMVTRLGSFTRAAQQLRLSQSAVSLLVRELETQLQIPLFNRGRLLTLTQAGEEFFATAERLLGDLDMALNDLAGLQSRKRGKITVAVGIALAATILPDVLRRFKAQAPDITVVIRDVTADQLVPRVLAAEVDFAIGTHVGGRQPAVDTTVLTRDYLGVLFPERHPLARQARVRWRDLAPYPIIVVNPRNTLWQRAISALHARGVELSPAYEVFSPSTAIGLTQEGLGVAVANPLSNNAPGLLGRTLHEPKIPREIVLTKRRGTALPPAATSFIELFADRLNRRRPRAG